MTLGSKVVLTNPLSFFTKGAQIWHNDTLLYVHYNKIQTSAMILGVISQGQMCLISVGWLITKIISFFDKGY